MGCDATSNAGTSPAEFGLRIDVSPSVGATLGRAFVSWDLLRREKEFSSNKAMEGQITVPLLGPGLVHVGAVSFRCALPRVAARTVVGVLQLSVLTRSPTALPTTPCTPQVHVHSPVLATCQDPALNVRLELPGVFACCSSTCVLC